MELIDNDDAIKFWFSCVPKPEELCCIIGYVDTTEAFKLPGKSNYHQKVLKCRQIIFTEPQIIAAPSNTEVCAVYVIMKKEMYRTGRIQKLLEKLKLNVSNSETVSVAIYEACLCYTLIARLSPLWNQVDRYLVQGRDFLLNSGIMNAVKVEVVIRDGEIFLLVWSVRVTLPALHLEHLEAQAAITETIVFKETERVINLPWGVNFAQVLPSLRKCCIVHVSNHLTDHCVYKSYKEMRRHWKNMYGYRLPEAIPDNLLFYGVKFQSPSCNEFTYPSICLRPHGLVFFRNADQKAILRSFLSDLIAKLPTVCGTPFGVEPKVGVAVPKLHFSKELLEHPNVVLFDAEILSKDHQDNASQPLESSQPVPGKGDASEPTTSVTTHKHQTALCAQKENLSLSSAPIYMPVTLPRSDDFQGNVIKRPKFVPVFKQKNPTFGYMKRYLQNKFEAEQRSNLISHAANFSEMPIKFGLYEQPVSPQTSGASSKVPPLKVKLVPCAISKPHFLSEMSLSAMCSLIDGTKIKKPRSRPQVQTGVDVEALVRGNDLSRVNTATLVNWLRNKNIPCKVKDRKADLVAKVMDYFKIDNQ